MYSIPAGRGLGKFDSDAVAILPESAIGLAEPQAPEWMTYRSLFGECCFFARNSEPGESPAVQESALDRFAAGYAVTVESAIKCIEQAATRIGPTVRATIRQCLLNGWTLVTQRSNRLTRQPWAEFCRQVAEIQAELGLAAALNVLFSVDCVMKADSAYIRAGIRLKNGD